MNKLEIFKKYLNPHQSLKKNISKGEDHSFASDFNEFGEWFNNPNNENQTS